MNIEITRRKIVSGHYEITQHAKDEAANDGLDIRDLESIVLTGKIIRKLDKDPRGIRYVIGGMCQEKKQAELVCRVLPSGKLRIITVYLK